jgi:hypothetical protein
MKWDDLCAWQGSVLIKFTIISQIGVSRVLKNDSAHALSLRDTLWNKAARSLARPPLPLYIIAYLQACNN